MENKTCLKPPTSINIDGLSIIISHESITILVYSYSILNVMDYQ